MQFIKNIKHNGLSEVVFVAFAIMLIAITILAVVQ